MTTNPTAPHLLGAYDNLGRQTASAGYSSRASIVVGTDEPVTEATNRLSLSRTYYDERGQVWKTTRHQIDSADGSDDDNLEELVWYDAMGREIKHDGHSLSKSLYDQIGRVHSRGRRLTVTQYDASSGGGVVDQVKLGYDGSSNVTSFAQDTNRAVGQSGSVDDYALTHAYAKATGGRNSVRRMDSTYSSGKSVITTYSNSAGLQGVRFTGGIQVAA